MATECFPAGTRPRRGIYSVSQQIKKRKFGPGNCVYIQYESKNGVIISEEAVVITKIQFSNHPVMKTMVIDVGGQ
jgi:hypothetical protein